MHPHLRRATRRAVLAAAAAAGLLVPAAASAAPASCPAVGQPYTAGVNCRTVDMHGYQRQFLVYVPAWAPFSESHPLVFMYHGSGETGEYFLRMSGWREKADQTGLIAVFPTGVRYQDKDTLQPTTKWNDGKLDSEVNLDAYQPPGYPATAPWPADDVAFTDAMLADLEAYLPVDKHRVYASGFSNGAGFTARLAAERSTVFAAAAFSAGSLQLPETAERAIPTFMTVGSLDDRILPQTGTPPLTELPMNYVDLLSVPVVASTIDTELALLKVSPINYGTEIAPHETEIHWPASGDSIYRFMVIQGLQHRYPNDTNNPAGFVAADAFWRFFSGIRLP